MSQLPAAFLEALAPAALGLVGVVAAEDARGFFAPRARGEDEDPLAGARALVVVASGGRAFWERLDPVARRTEEHPIDRAGRDAIAAALPALGAGARLLDQDVFDRFDLRRLAERAGLGVVSPHLLLLLHPTYGPWVSVRGLVATPEPLTPATPLAWDPCGPCPRPCLDACPAGAYRRDGPFDVGRCADHRLRSDDVPPPDRPCADRCRSRAACVIGPEHAYGPDEMRHRHRAGLPMLRAWRGR